MSRRRRRRGRRSGDRRSAIGDRERPTGNGSVPAVEAPEGDWQPGYSSISLGASLVDYEERTRIVIDGRAVDVDTDLGAIATQSSTAFVAIDRRRGFYLSFMSTLGASSSSERWEAEEAVVRDNKTSFERQGIALSGARRIGTAGQLLLGVRYGNTEFKRFAGRLRLEAAELGVTEQTFANGTVSETAWDVGVQVGHERGTMFGRDTRGWQYRWQATVGVPPVTSYTDTEIEGDRSFVERFDGYEVRLYALVGYRLGERFPIGTDVEAGVQRRQGHRRSLVRRRDAHRLPVEQDDHRRPLPRCVLVLLRADRARLATSRPDRSERLRPRREPRRERRRANASDPVRTRHRPVSALDAVALAPHGVSRMRSSSRRRAAWARRVARTTSRTSTTMGSSRSGRIRARVAPPATARSRSPGSRPTCVSTAGTGARSRPARARRSGAAPAPSLAQSFRDRCAGAAPSVSIISLHTENAERPHRGAVTVALPSNADETTIMNFIRYTALPLSAVLALGAAGTWAAGPVNLSDLDGDGVISAEEIAEAHEERRAAMLEQFDVDGDGELSGAERGAARDAREAERLATFDTDGDGELSHAERGAAKDARRAALAEALDVDGDGEVSEAERAGIDEVREERGDRGGRGDRGDRGDGRGERGDRV